MVAMAISTVFILVSCLVVKETFGQDCKPNPLEPSQTFPDLFEMTKGSYMFSVEANLPESKTEYITEFVDTKTMRSLVEVTVNGLSTTYYLFHETNEVFIIKGKGCTSMDISSAYDRDDVHWVLKNQATDFYIGMGPSSLIIAAHKAFKANGQIGVEKNLADVRGMQCLQWIWCNGKDKVTFYFTDGRSIRPYGLSGQVPLRITVEDENKKVRSYEFFRMVPNVWSKRLEQVLEVPATVGCQRLKEVRSAPSFQRKNVYLEAEVIYTPGADNDKGYTYVTNLKYIVHRNPKMIAIHWTPWTNKKNGAGVTLPGDNLFRIYTKDFIYTVDKTTDECLLTRANDQGGNFTFPLPGGSNLDSIKEDLLFDGIDAPNYHYIGKAMERGISALIFEKKEEDINALPQRIITRYYADDDVMSDNEFKEANAPMKSILWSIDPEKFVGELIINIYSFQSRLTRVHELFDVSKCFKEKSQSVWFQIAMPLENYDRTKVKEQLYLLKNSLGSELQAYDKDKSPLRVPRLAVDMDNDYIYTTGLILERPGFILDYDLDTTQRKLKDGPKSRTVGLMTLDECAKACLTLSQCESFSYCGAVCTVATEKINKDTHAEEKDRCEFYTNRDKAASVWTMRQLSESIRARIESRALEIPLPTKNNVEEIMDLVADSYRELGFGLDRPGPKTEDMTYMFSVRKSEAKLKTGIASSVKQVSFEGCKLSCSRMPSCESMSYCLATAECVLSDKHGIEEEDMENNGQCMVLNRDYLARFMEHSGLIVVHTARSTVNADNPEACAKLCVQENGFDCKSFDFCAGEKFSCLMHAQHFDNRREDDFKANQYCRHFSRNFVHDFQSSSNQVMVNSEVGLVVGNITAEACSRLCKDKKDSMPCAGFDVCGDFWKGTSTCTLRKRADSNMKSQQSCNTFTWRK